MPFVQRWMLFTFILPITLAQSYESMTAVLARINVSYENPVSGSMQSISAEIGRFAEGAVGSASGILATGVTNDTPAAKAVSVGCSPKFENIPTNAPWVGLFIRGNCPDEQKVRNAKALNATAVLLYGNDQETYLKKENKFGDGPVVIYLLQRKGELFWHLVQSGTKVTISITKGQEVRFQITNINRTSVLFVSVSFIVLMVISLAWLVFYYVQRFRYINAKDRLAKHLSNAAKKALSKIPDRHLRNGDKELLEKESCAVCIEPYMVGEIIRILPCKHHFHKACVDPWLLDHRTCPMCKMDILKHYGFTTSQDENGARTDPEEVRLPAPRRISINNRSRETPTVSPQVSVISTQSTTACDLNTLERASSNPVGDVPILPPISSHSVSGIGTTTSSVIRSMLQSARSRVLSAHNSDIPGDCPSTIVPIQDTTVIVEKKSGPSDKFGDSISDSMQSNSPQQSSCDVEKLVSQALYLDDDDDDKSSLSEQPASLEIVDEIPKTAPPLTTLTEVYCPHITEVPSQHSCDLTAIDIESTINSLGIPESSSRKVSLANVPHSAPFLNPDDELEAPTRRPSTTVSISHS